MKFPDLLSLPPTIILLCASSTAAESAPKQQWPHNLPDHLKYFPEEESHVKRGLEVQARLQNERPIGVKKMSGDEGEMFFLDNWIFAPDHHQNLERQAEGEGHSNITSQIESPLRPHSSVDSYLRFHIRDVLMQRDFKCPSGTNDCSSIGAPNSCCGTSETCISIQDTGFGPVGCCGKGQQCHGSIHCDTANGYTSCPNSSNGGCCLPGFSCQDVGCVIAGTSVTYVASSTSSTRSSSVSSTTPPTSTSTSSSSYICSTGWFSCAASLGGGCCQNGRTCATGASCIGSDLSTSTLSASSTAAPSAPVRPTSGADSSQTTSNFPTESLCPTGFYACQAYYPSGCCRIGRDCQTTGSCILPTPSSTLVNSNGVTIVAPSGGSFATTAAGQGGSCPSAWYSCPADRGGNCCPQGFACGEQCTATSGTGVTGKVAPSQATVPSVGLVWGLLCGALAVGVSMIVL